MSTLRDNKDMGEFVEKAGLVWGWVIKLNSIYIEHIPVTRSTTDIKFAVLQLRSW